MNASFLEKLRGIAQLGLHYAKDPFDRERYSMLMDLTADGYGAAAGVAPAEARARFERELGHVTPKVGVNGALFSGDGKIFLTRRADDRCWEVPGGWADLGESPRDAVRREFLEETSLIVTATDLVDVLHRLPGDFGQPHTTYHLVFSCVLDGGEFSPNAETLEYGWFDPSADLEWHRDHARMARLAAAKREGKESRG